MAAHEAPDGLLTRLEADRLRARALELVAELDGIFAEEAPRNPDEWRERITTLCRWAGAASVILKELARG